MYNEKYVYIRTVGSAADDDDNTSSCLVPVSSLRGVYVLSATLAIVTFHSLHDVKKTGGSTRDAVFVNVSSGDVPTFLDDFYKEIATGENPMIVLGDDVNSEYISSVITSIGNITVSKDET